MGPQSLFFPCWWFCNAGQPVRASLEVLKSNSAAGWSSHGGGEKKKIKKAKLLLQFLLKCNQSWLGPCKWSLCPNWRNSLHCFAVFPPLRKTFCSDRCIELGFILKRSSYPPFCGPVVGCCILCRQKSYSPGRREECHLLKSLLSGAGVLIVIRQFCKWPLTSWCGLFMTMLVVIFHLEALFTPLGLPHPIVKDVASDWSQ